MGLGIVERLAFDTLTIWSTIVGTALLFTARGRRVTELSVTERMVEPAAHPTTWARVNTRGPDAWGHPFLCTNTTK